MSSDEFKLDKQRGARTGLGEAVFCQNKTVSQITAILESVDSDATPTLFTRLTTSTIDQLSAHLRGKLDYDAPSQTAFYRFDSSRPSRPGSVAIVTAGTSDAAPAREAERTLTFNHFRSTRFFDVGVAGLWRLLERVDEIRDHQIVIAAAGMDAALPSVLGGLLGAPIIVIPTSTGYGAARNGETALAASLASCAPGIVVCNIDNGYGAACAAIRILNTLKQPSQPQQ